MVGWLAPLYRRRRMLYTTAILLSLETLYLCYTRFDEMPLSAQGLTSNLPLDTVSDSKPKDNGAPPSQDKPQSQETSKDEGPELQMPLVSYGNYGQPPLKDLVSMGILSPDHLPTSSSSSSRLIIIGDVHGQLSELKDLLSKVDYSESRGDHVIFTGDLINKGPDSAEVVALAMKMGASAVRGNHEDRVLLAYENMNMQHSMADSDAKMGKSTNDMAKPSFSYGDYAARATARSLLPAQRTWLSKLPVILKLGYVPSYGNVVVVHAGLVPDVALENQDPWAVMNMRTLVYPAEQVRRELIKKQLEEIASKKTGKMVHVPDSEIDARLEASRNRREGKADFDLALPINGHDGRSWSKVWNEAQKQKDKDNRLTVVYGHDAKTGLNLNKYTFGLDSSCVKGGQLTALIFGSGHKGASHKIVSVDCQEAKGADKVADLHAR